MNKKTLFFSNIIGNVLEDDHEVKFNDYMSNYLIKNINAIIVCFSLKPQV